MSQGAAAGGISLLTLIVGGILTFPIYSRTDFYLKHFNKRGYVKRKRDLYYAAVSRDAQYYKAYGKSNDQLRAEVARTGEEYFQATWSMTMTDEEKSRYGTYENYKKTAFSLS